jgi:large subunit ribosomal protein L18Ae
MKIFATDAASARSRFWYFLSNLKRIKKANGEIISTREIFEQNPNNVKNYCIWLRYDSRSGTHNMMKEFRDVTINACVEKLCMLREFDRFVNGIGQ